MVLASGAFKCLSCTLPEQAWELPVTVRSLPDGGETQKCVFIDGPLLAPRLSLRSKNELFYKVRPATVLRATALTMQRKRILPCSMRSFASR